MARVPAESVKALAVVDPVAVPPFESVRALYVFAGRLDASDENIKLPTLAGVMTIFAPVPEVVMVPAFVIEVETVRVFAPRAIVPEASSSVPAIMALLTVNVALVSTSSVLNVVAPVID